MKSDEGWSKGGHSATKMEPYGTPPMKRQRFLGHVGMGQNEWAGGTLSHFKSSLCINILIITIQLLEPSKHFWGQ